MENKNNEDFDINKIFNISRETFNQTIKKITEYQKDFEKIVANFNSNNKKHNNDLSKMFSSWLKSLQQIQKDISKVAKNSITAYLPVNIEFPFTD